MSNNILDAVIVASWDELSEIGIYSFLKGETVKVWDYGKYPDKEYGDCSKFAKKYDDEDFYYIPNKFIEII